MNWPLIRTTLAAVASSATGITAAGAVAWKGSKDSGGFRQGARIDLSHSSARGLGRDEVRHTSDELDPYANPAVTVCGARQFTWTVRIETPRQSDDGIAHGYADRLRAGVLGFKRVRALLAQGKLAVASIGPTTTVEFSKDGRDLSVAVTDFVLNAAENIVDASEGAGDWVESVGIESNDLYNTDGTTVDPPIEIEVSR